MYKKIIENMFEINKDTKFFLYGAASIGKIIFSNLIKQQIAVEGFIDKRAQELDTFLDTKVFTFDEFRLLDFESVIIIAVKNVFEHYQIAQNFIQAGFNNLIFMPKSVLEGEANEDDIFIANIYNSLVNGEKLRMGIKIKKTRNIEMASFCDKAIISEDEMNVIARIPVSFIYTNDYEKSANKWGNINALAFFPHLNFFGYLLGDESCNVNDYIEEYCVYSAEKQGDIIITSMWKENVLHNRAMIFQQMNKAYELDNNFFVRNPATAVWNVKRKYFNLTSGKHRVMFLVSKGNEYIPLKMTKDDYKQFLNIDEASKVYKQLSNRTFSYNIDNPFFYLYPSADYGFMHNLTRVLVKYLAEEIYEKYNVINFAKMKIFFDSSYECMARTFERMETHTVCMYNNEINQAVCKLEQTCFCESSEAELKLWVGQSCPDFEKYDYLCIEHSIESTSYNLVKTIVGYADNKIKKNYIFRRDIEHC